MPALRFSRVKHSAAPPWNGCWHEGCEVQLVEVSTARRGIVGRIVRARPAGGRWKDWEPDAPLDDLFRREMLPWKRLKDAKSEARRLAREIRIEAANA